jgi:hypothetical protein
MRGLIFRTALSFTSALAVFAATLPATAGRATAAEGAYRAAIAVSEVGAERYIDNSWRVR